MNMLLYQILAWKNIKKTIQKKNKFKMSAPTWTEEFEYILRNHGKNTDNLSIRIYVNKM